MSTKYEPLVPLEEFGMERMTAAELRAYASLTDIEVLPDYLDRPSVSLQAAYAIAEKRRAAEREWNEAELRRHTEHAKAVADLEKRCNAAFLQARAAHLAATVGRGFFGGHAETDGTALNEGLRAAREIWAAAPPDVREAVTSVEYEENGTINAVPLDGQIPLEMITDYLHKAARKF